MVVVLTGGWALVNAALPASEAVPAGQSMTLGSGEGYGASMTFDEGWELDTGSSTTDQQFLFAKGPVNLQVSVVEPTEGADAAQLWDGMRETVRVGDSSATLGEPEPVTSEGGAQGLTGDLHMQEHTGIATVFPSPNGGFAVETQAIGAEASAADLVEAERMVQSIRFDRSTGGTP
ncbi:hypothetical protein KGD82_17770 [Nocardiopsis eucommiae]|uniref:Uncharacterized protein n=1 Tax=Nocardiopsis eucommiae TaxID=2831970 RepID=A0A975LCL2_9ACTN|nr:hypothetical protein KGD82_17770 [Nocardiopsis eucommiae]